MGGDTAGACRDRGCVEKLEGRLLLAVAPVGTPFQVDADTTGGGHYSPVVAFQPGGRFAVAWEIVTGIELRLFEADGTPRGGDITVHGSVNDPRFPDMAADAEGDLVVVYSAEGRDGSGREVFARRYNADGQPGGDAFVVNTTRAGGQSGGSVAMNAAGASVVTWQSNGSIFAQRFDASGAPQGVEFRVNAQEPPAGGDFVGASVAMAPDGSFVVEWHQLAPFPGPGAVYFRRFSPTGRPLGGDALVDTDPSTLSLTHLAMDRKGNFTIVWTDLAEGDWATMARRYRANGKSLGAKFRVDEAEHSTLSPSAAMGADGELAVVWESIVDSQQREVMLRTYDPAGKPRTEPILASPPALEPQQGLTGNPSVAISPEGDMVVAWHGQNMIHAQRYERVDRPASVGGVAWHDLDEDGIRGEGGGDSDHDDDDDRDHQRSGRDRGEKGSDHDDDEGAGELDEPGVVGVRVELFTAEGVMAAAQRTDRDGRYVFDNLRPGEDYYVRFEPPPLYYFTAADQGHDDSRDSDADPATGRTGLIRLRPGRRDFTVDAGLLLGGIIEAEVWGDINYNGVREANEFPTAAAIAPLQLFTPSGELVQVGAVTPATGVGYYRFEHVPPGEYYLHFTPPQGRRITLRDQGSDEALDSDADRLTARSHIFTLAAGQILTDIDAGHVQANGIVTGTVYGDINGDGVRQPAEQGLQGGLVYSDLNGNGVFDQSEPAATFNDGRYRLEGLLPGPNTIRLLLQPHWTATTPTALNLTLTPGQRVDDRDFGVRVPQTAMMLRALGSDAVQVNAVTAGPQKEPATVVLTGGSFAVVYQSLGQDGGGLGVFGQRFSAAGQKLGPEFRVNGATQGDQGSPTAAALPDGGFVVAWQSAGQDGSGAGVYARLFNAAGTPLGEEFLVNNSTEGDQAAPAMARFGGSASPGGGGFIVAWTGKRPEGVGSDIYARRFSASGVPLGAEFVVSAEQDDNQVQPAVAADAAGRFTVVWTDSGGQRDAILGRAFDAEGRPVGQETRIAAFFEPFPRRASVAMSADGSAVVAWQTGHLSNLPFKVFARRFGPGLALLGAEFTVTGKAPSTTDPDPSVVTLADGSFVIVYNACTAQAFNPAGQKQGQPVNVCGTSGGRGRSASLAGTPAGHLVVSWSRESFSDASNADIFTRVLSLSGVTNPASAISGAAVFPDAGIAPAHPGSILADEGDPLIGPSPAGPLLRPKIFVAAQRRVGRT